MKRAGLVCLVCRRLGGVSRGIGEGMSAAICDECFANPRRVVEARRRVEAVS